MRASPTRQKSQSPKPEKSSPVSAGRMAGGEKWRVSRAEGNVVHVQCDIKGEQWEQHFLLRSDAHHDNPKSDRSLELKHLQEAVGYDAGVIDCGDLFCAMQGKYDKRSSKSDIRPEHQAGDYLDRLVRCAADVYEPFASSFVCIGDGNHETSIRDRMETDLNERLCATLSDRTGVHVHHSGYTGWVVFHFTQGTERSRKVLWYTHGYGGGGPVTQDTIQAQRQRAYIRADIICSGHTHDQWAQFNTVLGINHNGFPERLEVTNVKLGTYKDDYGDGKKSWPVQKGMPPKPLGQQWLTFSLSKGKVITTITRAQ